MIKHSEAARLCALVYTGDPSDWTNLFNVGGIVAGHQHLADGSDLLVLRGSYIKEDWVRDFEAVPYNDSVLGLVHEGFFTGVDELLTAVLAKVPKIDGIYGHSLGAAHAWIAAGRLSSMHKPVKQVVCFGSPRPGAQRLRDIIMLGASELASYRNGFDPVTQVPLCLPPLLDFRKVVDYKLVVEFPPGSALDFFGYHHIQNYVAGVTKYESTISGGQSAK